MELYTYEIKTIVAEASVGIDVTFKEIQQTSLRDQVIQQVRQAIVEGQLKLGSPINENLLTEQLGVSRTPVREALILLERDGLIEAIPNRGFFVRMFTERDVLEFFSIRTNLENFAAELALDSMTEEDLRRLDAMIDCEQKAIEAGDFRRARSIDMDFHRFLVAYPKHSLLIRYWEEIVAQIAALLNNRAEAFPDYDEYLAIRDHCWIVDAYRARDLVAIHQANKTVNNRVYAECVASLARLQGC